MLQGEVRKDDWSILADTIYLNFGQHGSPVNTASGLLGPRETQRSFETTFRGTLIQLGGARTVLRRSWGNVDAIVGLRYLGVKATLDAPATRTNGTGVSQTPEVNVSQVQNIFDGIGGVRERVMITNDGRWSGVEVERHMTYRYLAFYGSGDQLVQTLRFNGPSFNVTLRS